MTTFGRSMLAHWLLDPDSTYLNHGTVGVTPRRVLQQQQALRDEMERHPSRFMLRELNGAHPAPWRAVSRLREASDQIAAFVGSRPEDLVFVPNVTAGLNAVLKSLPLGSADEVVITDLAYGAIAKATRFVCDRAGAELRTIRIDYPVREPGHIVDAIVCALTSRTKLVVRSVFVPNVTAGLNAVLKSLRLGSADEVVITDLAYGAIAKATRFVCDRAGAELRTIRIDYPVREPGHIVDAIVCALTSRTKLVV